MTPSNCMYSMFVSCNSCLLMCRLLNFTQALSHQWCQGRRCGLVNTRHGGLTFTYQEHWPFNGSSLWGTFLVSFWEALWVGLPHFVVIPSRVWLAKPHPCSPTSPTPQGQSGAFSHSPSPHTFEMSHITMWATRCAEHGKFRSHFWGKRDTFCAK